MSALLVIGGIMAAVACLAWLLWPWIKNWFRDSETLFFARLQMAVGALWWALVATDILPALNALGAVDPAFGKWVPLIMVAWGIITEAARRSRAIDL